MYFNSDNIIIMCRVNDRYCGEGKCVGYDDIPTKIEELSCKLSSVLSEINSLVALPDYIKDHQEYVELRSKIDIKYNDNPGLKDYEVYFKHADDFKN